VKHVPRAGTLQLAGRTVTATATSGAPVLPNCRRRDLGKPRPPTWTMVCRVLASRSHLRPISRVPRGSARWPVRVGRASERRLLQGHSAGEGAALCMLGGEPGIGKIRLLEEATVLAEARGMSVACGSVTLDAHLNPPDPLRQALRQPIQKRSLVQLRQDLAGCAWLVRVPSSESPGLSDVLQVRRCASSARTVLARPRAVGGGGVACQASWQGLHKNSFCLLSGRANHEDMRISIAPAGDRDKYA
jgi:hypothetical protein